MRLQKIKLAGFKSFVDPTTITLPSGLVGVVGPNGCGKSNVIDAVRWVMGEVSAKHLRGGSMADVVFNGSVSRKPVGQASVEVVFDNSEGRLGGQYAGFQEIAVRRQVGRDGQSSYYLNGSRCRRRDITDVFLGTGLGPRSYAIIEQGMISRIVEARPDELREFLEEAAGISKYKERRRETENRIRHTRENLDRVNDLREELARRLQHLKRQATMAEKYKVLKEQERRLRAELLTLRWRSLDTAAQGCDNRLAAQDTAVEGVLAEQRRIEAELETQRSAHAGVTDEFNEVYRRTLEAGAELARTEETIQNLRRRREQLRTSVETEKRALDEAAAHLGAEAERMRALEETLGESEPKADELDRKAAGARSEYGAREEAMHDWQSEWEDLSQRIAVPAEDGQTERARLHHLEERLARTRERLERLHEALASVDWSDLERGIGGDAERLAAEEDRLAQLEGALGKKRVELRDLRDHIGELSTVLHVARERYQEIRGRLASLQALQQEALGRRPGAVTEWLAAQELGERPRLAEKLDAAPGWERALETVLGFHLEAVCVEGTDDLSAALESFGEGSLGLFDTAAARESATAGAPTGVELREKIRAPWPIDNLLAGLYAADTLEQALAMRSALKNGESVITPDGDWVGANWLRLVRKPEDESGVLRREREIKKLAMQTEEVRGEIDDWQARLDEAGDELRTVEEAHGAVQGEIAEAHRHCAKLTSRLGEQRAELEQMRRGHAQMEAEQVEQRALATVDEQGIETAKARIASLSTQLEALGAERESLLAEREARRRRLDEARDCWQAIRDEAYEARLRIEAVRTELASLVQSRTRNEAQMERLQTRWDGLQAELSESEGPLREAEASMEERLARQRELDEVLREARRQVEALEAAVREQEQHRHRNDARLQSERATLEQLRLESQEINVRRDTLSEQLGGMGQDLAGLLQELPAEALEEDWNANIEKVERQITRLGPINLAAIDEYEQQSERKGYLDAQHEDLTEALATLEEAIQKIDRETRARFKDTYERVNAALTNLFPRLFGGGSAHLELTGTDLLNTGISVMARPPGKRNSTIHLLSGGEKALVAVALMFALFELNPAPFCLLDEVDAPLDDANVGRFCELVKDIAERVQFVLVTHNKSTMEITHHLVGVTMNEPGVSRLVAVDVDEAVQMAAM